MDTVVTTLTLFTLLGAALMAGVFYAFSTFVMKALASVPAAAGMAAMQSINVVVINAQFLAVFFGAALTSILLVIMVIYDWQSGSAWLVGGGLFYVVGTFLVTIACNVPLNRQLASASAQDKNGQDVWAHYLQRWTWWNHVRTVAAVIATGLFALGLLAM